jgi:pre-mRNA-processing factor 39
VDEASEAVELKEEEPEEPQSSPEQPEIHSEESKESEPAMETKEEPIDEPMDTSEEAPKAKIEEEEEVKVKEEEEAKEEKAEKRKRRGFSDTPPEDLEPPKKIKGLFLNHDKTCDNYFPDCAELNGDAKEEKKKLPELDKYWKAVKDDSSDFTGWTYLLQYVDQEVLLFEKIHLGNNQFWFACHQSDADAAREAYDAFLALYPYCYGYWRKYADYEKKKGDATLSDKVTPVCPISHHTLSFLLSPFFNASFSPSRGRAVRQQSFPYFILL